MARKAPLPPAEQTSTRPIRLGRSQAIEDHTGLERLVFFSDAVFAIAITLLALEIRLPVADERLSNQQLLQNLLSIWPKYLGYIISFLVLGVFWQRHHQRFRFIKRYNQTLVQLNLLLLMVVGFVPFPTSVLSEHGNRTATIFYAATMILLGLLMTAVWAYASHNNRLTDQDLDPQQRRHDIVRLLIVPAVFLLSIGIALFNDDLAKFSWILIAVAARIIGD